MKPPNQTDHEWRSPLVRSPLRVRADTESPYRQRILGVLINFDRFSSSALAHKLIEAFTRFARGIEQANTLVNAYAEAKKFFIFVCEDSGYPDDHIFTRDTLRDFKIYLDTRKISARIRQSILRIACCICNMLPDFETVFPRDFDIYGSDVEIAAPKRHIRSLSELANQQGWTDKQLLRLFLDYCWDEIEQSWSKFSQRAQLAAIARPHLNDSHYVTGWGRSRGGPEDGRCGQRDINQLWVTECLSIASNSSATIQEKRYYRDLAWLLAYVEDYLDGIPEHITHLHNLPMLGRYETSIARIGGVAEASAFFFPTCRELSPFFAVFAAAHVNPMSIHGIRVDHLRMSDDPAWATLGFNKPRAGGEVVGPTFPIGGRNARTIPRAFEKLKAYTEPIRERLSANDPRRGALFLCRLRRVRGDGFLDQATYEMLQVGFTKLVERFWKSVGAANVGVRPFSFSASNVRASAIVQAHQDGGMDLEQTRILTRHRGSRTTTLYVDRMDVRTGMVAEVRKGMEALEQWVRTTQLPVIRAEVAAVLEALQLPDTPENREAATAYLKGDLGLGHGMDCRNPTKGPPRFRDGNRCDYLVGCWTCQQCIIITTPLNWARIRGYLDHLIAHAPTLKARNTVRWRRLYEPQLNLLEQVLADFPPEIERKGRGLLPRLKPLFPPLH
jgi:hypothetical protein